MIVLQPHALKGCVLFAVFPAPGKRFWIRPSKQDPNAFVDDGDSAKPATMTIPLDETPPQQRIGSAWLGTVDTWQQGRRARIFSYAKNGLVVPTPNGLGPLSNSRNVGGYD